MEFFLDVRVDFGFQRNRMRGSGLGINTVIYFILFLQVFISKNI